MAKEIGFPDTISSVTHAISKHATHASILKIKERFGDIEDTFSFTCVDSNTVMSYLKKLNPRKATGFDNIPCKILKLAHNELATPIAFLMNSTIHLNSFPVQMKRAEVSPLFKKSDKMCKKNFRPVSILTALSKLLERILNDQLVSHFSNIFHEMLSAFRRGYSCQSLLLKFVEDAKGRGHRVSRDTFT